MKKRLASVMLALCVALTMLPISALATEETPETDNQTTESSKAETIGEPSAVEGEAEKQTPSMKISEPTRSSSTASGACGENATWKLENETLIISGAGDMDGYYYNPNDPDDDSVPGCKKAPWYSLRDQIKTVVIHDGISSIGMSAFFGCSQLTSATIPNSVHLIDAYAFSSCSSFASITLPNGITDIHPYTFEGCVNLTEVAIPDSVTTIWAGAFGGCSSLTSITLPQGLTSVGDHSFSYCGNLSTIKLPNNVARIENHAFAYCVKLKSATIPRGVEYIGWNAFTHCYELADVYYGGSKKDWNSIDKDDNERLKADDIIIHCTDGNIKVGVECKIFRNGGYEVFDISLEDCLKRSDIIDANGYNPQLAHMLISMCYSAHNETEIRNTFTSFGFNKYMRADLLPLTFSIGIKERKNESPLVLVVARGTVDIEEWISNLDTTTNERNQHSGFSNAAEELYRSLDKFLSDKGTSLSNVELVITGFSRGAAAVNILSARLVDEGFSKEKIHTYTFACPDVACITQGTANNYKYSCIFNLGNVNDPITWVPRELLPIADSSGRIWDKYGQTYWYCENWNDYQHILDKPHNVATVLVRVSTYHGEEFYQNYLRDEKSTNEYKMRYATTNIIEKAKDKRYQKYVRTFGGRFTTKIGIHCPVDVEIRTIDGTLIGTATDGTSTELITGKIYINVEGDQKDIFLLDNDLYVVNLTGIDKGSMEYSVQNINIDTWEILEEKNFSNVTISNGKKMISYVNTCSDGASINIPNVQLFVLDNNGEPEREVLSDGNGTEIPFQGNNIENSGNNNPSNGLNIKAEPSTNTTLESVDSTQNTKSPSTKDSSPIALFCFTGILAILIFVATKYRKYFFFD